MSREAVRLRGSLGFLAPPKGGDALHSSTVITTEPNALISPIHNRMPLICDEATGRQWLERNHGPHSILRPWPAERMQAHDVSNFVNAPENDSPAGIKRLPAGYCRPGQLPLV
jgi:putative SOS response-associated peptidase YedK